MGAAHLISWVNPAKGISPLLAVGSLVGYTFPTTAEVGVDAPWSCDVENVGTEGVIAFGIVNDAGSPGDMVVTWGGAETVIAPGYYWRVYTTIPVAPGTHLRENGTVRFEAMGTYAVRLWAMHEDAGSWLYDEEVLLSPGVSPPPWPVTYELHSFANHILSCNFYEQYAGVTTGILTDTSVLLGGRVRYAITYVKGSDRWPQPLARLYWNDMEILELEWKQSLGQSVGFTHTGSIDLPNIQTENDLKIQLVSSLGGGATVKFDIFVDLGYSEEPPDPPEDEGRDWLEWWDDLGIGKQLAYGGFALGVVYIVVRKPRMPAMPTIITLPIPQWIEERRSN